MKYIDKNTDKIYTLEELKDAYNKEVEDNKEFLEDFEVTTFDEYMELATDMSGWLQEIN